MISPLPVRSTLSLNKDCFVPACFNDTLSPSKNSGTGGVAPVIDVQDPVRNLILNTCFFAIAFLVIVSLVPWKSLGANRVSRLLRWLPLPMLGLAVLYESTMPSRFDIRIDLLLLLPAYVLIAISSIVRYVGWRRANASPRLESKPN